MTEVMSKWAKSVMEHKYSHDIDGRKEEWPEIAFRVTKNVLGAIDITEDDLIFKSTLQAIVDRKFIPGGRYLYAAGRPYHQVNNCILLRAEDSREGWADLLRRSTMALMTGAGIGIDYSDVRPEGDPIRKTGGFSTGPLALMQIINEAARGIMQGGSRRSAVWAGLNWSHRDIFKFIAIKNWSDDIKAMKLKDFNAYAPMDMTNISVLLDDAFFEAYHNESHAQHEHAQKLYWQVVTQMMQNGEPGFSVDVGENTGETLRNACTEITSRDDNDVCNLGSINLARVSSLEEMEELVDLGVLFLIAGTIYSDVPYSEVADTRTKNRRLGLGLMGIHEWLLQRGLPYKPSKELEPYLEVYAKSTEKACIWADMYGLSHPVKTRAVAPNGTIGIVGETTTSGEPLFAAAYRRRRLVGKQWEAQYVVDPVAKRLVESGVDPDTIEDAYKIAEKPEVRVEFQAWLQGYVDHGISSTINLPSWGSEHNNQNKVKDFGDMLIRYLPKLRGITAYPDGARGGQPLTPADLKIALKSEGEIFIESVDICDITKTGSCGT